MAHLGQQLEPNHLPVEQPRGDDGDGLEGFPHGLEVLGLDVLPLAEVGVVHLLRDDPVHHHGVHPIAEQREVRVGPPGLGDHHLLGVHHQAHARHPVVGQELADPVEVAVQPLHRGEDSVVGDGHRRDPRQQGPDRLHHPALHREDPFDVPVHGLREREEPERLGGGRAVHHQQVVPAGIGVARFARSVASRLRSPE